MIFFKDYCMYFFAKLPFKHSWQREKECINYDYKISYFSMLSFYKTYVDIICLYILDYIYAGQCQQDMKPCIKGKQIFIYLKFPF